MDKRVCLETIDTGHLKETGGYPTHPEEPSKKLFPTGTGTIGHSDPAGSFGGLLTPCPSTIHIDPQRKQMCAVHALRNVAQDKAGDVIADALLVQGAIDTASRLGEHVLGGGNFSTEAMYDAVDMLDSFSIRVLSYHILAMPAKDLCRGAFADVENIPVAGLVMHISKRGHYVALLRDSTPDTPQILLLDSVYPNRIEILSPEQFHAAASSSSAIFRAGKHVVQYDNITLQVLRGKVAPHDP
jgi:hypothetical protein